GEDGEGVDVAFVENAEHDIDDGDGDNQQDAHVLHGILEDLGGALEGAGDGGGQGLGGLFNLRSGGAERGAGLESEGNGDGGKLAGVRDALRTGVGDQFGDGAQGTHVAVVALHVDQVEPVGVFLVG